MKCITSLLALLLLASVPAAGQTVSPAPAGKPGPMARPPGLGIPPLRPVPKPPLSLVGTWSTTARDAGRPTIHAVLVAKADGTFNMWVWRTLADGHEQTVQLWGNYRVRTVAPSSGVLHLEPAGWRPRQLCTAPGHCEAVRLAPTSNPVTVVGPDRFDEEKHHGAVFHWVRRK